MTDKSTLSEVMPPEKFANLQQEIFRLKSKRKLGFDDISTIVGIPTYLVKEIWYDNFVPEPIKTGSKFLSGATLSNPLEFKNLEISDDSAPITIDDDSALVLSDFHCPHQNEEMLQRAVAICKEYFPHIKICIIAGDTFDFESLSVYPQTSPLSFNADKSITSGGRVIRSLAELYSLFIDPGNHCERLAKKLNSPFDFRHIVNAAIGEHKTKYPVYATNYDYMYLGDKWLIGHPAQYSSIGGRMPSEIADLEQRNVATGHNHLIGMQSSKSGKYIGVDLGHLTNPKSHFYMQRRLTKFPRWNSGFMIIDNGFPYVFYENFTDWSRWL